MSDRSQRAKKGRRSSVDSVPVAGLSMFDRVFLGMDEDGRPHPRTTPPSPDP
jgi:hypothetical protein